MLEIHCNFTPGSKAMDTHNCGTGSTTEVVPEVQVLLQNVTTSECYYLGEKDS